MPQIGDKAPEFQAVDTQGQPIALADYRGRVLVLYFYPKDDTPGCTKQACGFRDEMAQFSGLEADVVGVSRDSAASHQRFTAKFDLPFRLIADTDEVVCEAYDVLRDKTLYGRVTRGIERTTFVIDREGVVRQVFRKVKVDGHIDEVLEAVRQLTHDA